MIILYLLQKTSTQQLLKMTTGVLNHNNINGRVGKKSFDFNANIYVNSSCPCPVRQISIVRQEKKKFEASPCCKRSFHDRVLQTR